MKERHNTVTAFVSSEGSTMLHWHSKNKMWLPPGGHIEPNEDPIEAVHREVVEETGFKVEILNSDPRFNYNHPPQITPPVTVMLETIVANKAEPEHEHIDMIYFTRPLEEYEECDLRDGWFWVSAESLMGDGLVDVDDECASSQIPTDVRVLGLAAIEMASGEQD